MTRHLLPRVLLVVPAVLGLALPAGDVASAVWDEPQSGPTNVGTFGRFLDMQSSTISAGRGASPSDIASAVWAAAHRTRRDGQYPGADRALILNSLRRILSRVGVNMPETIVGQSVTLQRFYNHVEDGSGFEGLTPTVRIASMPGSDPLGAGGISATAVHVGHGLYIVTYTFTAPGTYAVVWEAAGDDGPDQQFVDVLLGSGSPVETPTDAQETPAVVFSWMAVTGADHYEIQVSTASTFETIIGPNVVSGLSVSPSEALPLDQTYFWRVRAVATADPQTANDYGDWSEVWSFFLGTEAEPSHQSQAIFNPDALRFYITSSDPSIGDSGLSASQWSVSFNQEVDPAYVTSTYLALRKTDASGVPLADQSVAGTWAVAGRVITFTPSPTELDNTGVFTRNREYTLTVSSDVRSTTGVDLEEPQQLWFNSVYDPLYLGWPVIRLDLGDLVEDMPVDTLNRFIHMASLEVNRFQLPLPEMPYAGTPKPFSDVLDKDVSGPSYDVMQFVRARTELYVLKRKRAELLRYIDTRKTIGTFTQDEASVGLLEQIKHMIDELNATANALLRLIGLWSGPATWAQKSSRYLPWPYNWRNWDWAEARNSRTNGIPVAFNFSAWMTRRLR